MGLFLHFYKGLRDFSHLRDGFGYVGFRLSAVVTTNFSLTLLSSVIEGPKGLAVVVAVGDGVTVEVCQQSRAASEWCVSSLGRYFLPIGWISEGLERTFWV